MFWPAVSGKMVVLSTQKQMEEMLNLNLLDQRKAVLRNAYNAVNEVVAWEERFNNHYEQFKAQQRTDVEMREQKQEERAQAKADLKKPERQSKEQKLQTIQDAERSHAKWSWPAVSATLLVRRTQKPMEDMLNLKLLNQRQAVLRNANKAVNAVVAWEEKFNKLYEQFKAQQRMNAEMREHKQAERAQARADLAQARADLKKEKALKKVEQIQNQAAAIEEHEEWKKQEEEAEQKKFDAEEQLL